MGMTEMLRLVITADADQAVKKIKQLGGVSDSAAKSTDDLGKSSKQTGLLMKAGLVAGATAAAYAMVRFGASSVKAAAEAEQAQMRLDDAFAKFPKLADSSADALRGLNTEMQRKTRFDDDALASGQAILAQFDLTGKQLEEVTPLVADYAAKMGLDIPQASTNLGKALLGNMKALKSLGIDYKVTGDATADYANITALMAEKVGGFAEKEGKTAAGQLAILNNQFGELQETVGKALLPALSGLVTGTTAVVGAFGSLPEPVQKTALAIAGVSIAAGVVVPWIAKIKGALVELNVTAKATKATFATLSKAFAIAGVAFAAWDFAMKVKELGDLRTELRGTVTDLDRYRLGVDELRAAAKDANEIDWTWGWDTEGSNVWADIQNIASALGGNGGLTAEADAAQKKLDEAASKLDKMGGAAEGAAGTTGDLASVTGDAATATGDLAVDADAAAEAADAQAKKNADLHGALRDVNRELQEQITKLDILSGKNIDVLEAQIALMDGEQDMRDAIKESAGAIDERSTASRDARQSIIDSAKDIQGVTDALIAQGMPADQAAAKALVLRDALIKAAVEAGASKTEVELLTDAILLIPKQADVQFNIEVATALANMDAVILKLREAGNLTGEVSARQLVWENRNRQPITSSVTPGPVIYSGLGGSGAYVPNYSGSTYVAPTAKPADRRAVGGPVSAGTPYLVGEKGPELFVPNASGGIVPNGALSTSRAAGGSTMNVTVNVGGSVVGERDLVRAVRDGLVDMQRRGDAVAA